MMARTQILLDRVMLRRAQHRAAEAGISLGEYIRRLVADDLQAPKAVRDPSAVFNLGDSGGADIRTQKDDMIGQAMAARRAPRKRPR